MNIGNRIKKLRESKGLTQKELGKKVGVTAVTITRYERGDRNPSIEMLSKIADALDVTVNDLIGNEEIEEAKEIDLSSIPTKDLIKELNKRNDFKVTLGVVSDE